MSNGRQKRKRKHFDFLKEGKGLKDKSKTKWKTKGIS